MKRIIGYLCALITCAVSILLYKACKSRANPDIGNNGVKQVGPKWPPAKTDLQLLEDSYAAYANTEALFYGKVVDQYGVPVAKCRVYWVPFITSEPGLSETNMEVTNEGGLFTIRKARTPGFRIEASPGPGFWPNAASSGEFYFAIPPGAPQNAETRSRLHVADPAHPVEFTLEKLPEAEPLLVRSTNGVMKAEQTFQIGSSERQTVVVNYWYAGAAELAQVRWGAEVSIPNGGLVEITDPAKSQKDYYVAPETGYLKSYSYQMPRPGTKDSPLSPINAEFYLRFDDGTYGRIKFWLSGDAVRPFWTADSWYNPSGGRSTLHDRRKEIR